MSNINTKAAFSMTFLCFSFFSLYSNLLLTPPSKSGNETEIFESFKSVGGIFGGRGCNETRDAYFTYNNDNVGFIVRYFNSLPPEFTDLDKKQFIKQVDDSGKIIYEYSIGIIPEIYRKTLDRPITGSHFHGEAYRPLEFTGKSPKNIAIDECAQLIQNKKIVIMSGAGLSAAAGISTVPQLWKLLGRNLEVPVDQFTKAILCNVDSLKKIILTFYKAARDNQPTNAHYALTNLANYKNCNILTGNFDRLHERAGIIPYRVMYEDIDKDILPCHWKKVDIILTVGQRWDFRAILARFKYYNPRGIIIACNIEKPEYLADDDYFVQGDIQLSICALTEQVTRQ